MHTYSSSSAASSTTTYKMGLRTQKFNEIQMEVEEIKPAASLMDRDMEVETNEVETKPTAAWKPVAAMVLVQVFLSGMVLLSKILIGDGMFVFALLTYRSIFGAAFILPIALIMERGKWREMDWRACRWIFLNAFIGYAVPMSLYYYGLQDTTASYSVIYFNIIPLATLTLSLIFRMETLSIWSMVGQLKVAGALLCVGGTILISLYKGKALHLCGSIMHHHGAEQKDAATNQLRGTIFLVGSCFTFACWYLIQSKVLEVYPFKYWSSMATCAVGGFQTALVGIILRRDNNAWKLGWDLQLLTILYSGALATAGKYCLNSWAVAKRGPAYPPMFSSLSVVFTVILDSIFIGNDITVGSLIGTMMVIAGLYVFLWAKAKEKLEDNSMLVTPK